MIRISQEVKEALEKGKPVVALESTIITHGMPYPQNYETSLKVEETIRENGAIPATIAVINGECVVGLSKEEIQNLAKRRDSVKVSRRDLGFVCANRLNGGTTVAATMFLAEKAGIKVFVTGGIGGVHRGGNKSFDISADLDELGKTSVAVICAGAKAILDLPLTLEYLETKGVPVYGYQCEYLPAFYTATSPYKIDNRVETPAGLAKIMKAKWDLGVEGGILITNPVPEEYSIPYEIVETYIEDALKDLGRMEIQGKDITPFLLERITSLSEGDTLKTNIALVLNNAKLGAQIAVAYQEEAKKNG